MRFTLEELADAAGGTVVGDAHVDVDGLSVDTRSLEPGTGFVALVADRDGHDFVPAAIEAGASAVVVSSPVGDLPVPVLQVDDTAEALLEAGRLARVRLPDRVVGITGSVGKTSTKDLLAAVLGTRWVTAASERSFNNEIGVPLTLVGAAEDTGAAVVEMGARGPGHIALLCDIARPTAAVVTAVADAHLEMFGTLDDVAVAKGELVEALPSDGTAVLNADDARVRAMAARTTATVLTFGVGPASDADVRADIVTVDGTLRPHLHLHTPWGGVELTLAVCGAHQAANAVAAAACGLALGVDIDDVVEALEVATISGQRMQVELTPTGALLIDDAYNANPTSTRAALDALAAVAGASRRVAVLGVMAELGADGERLHREVAAHAQSLGIRVVSVGAPAYGVTGADAVDDVDAALGRLGPVGERDAVLVKGSRVAALERVSAVLREPAPATAPARP
jgi:UDP-N-acetylmuramoyl-tripeptide--D-alanyl-D-alanine ligase